MLKCLNKQFNYHFWLLYDTKTIWNCWKCRSTSPSSSWSVLIPVTGFEMVMLYLEWQQCTISDVCGFLWTPQRTRFVPDSYQSAKGQLAKDAAGQVHPWCDTREADRIESVMPQVFHQKSLLMDSPLPKLLLTSGKSSGKLTSSA